MWKRPLFSLTNRVTCRTEPPPPVTLIVAACCPLRVSLARPLGGFRFGIRVAVLTVSLRNLVAIQSRCLTCPGAQKTTKRKMLLCFLPLYRFFLIPPPSGGLPLRCMERGPVGFLGRGELELQCKCRDVKPDRGVVEVYMCNDTEINKHRNTYMNVFTNKHT